MAKQSKAQKETVERVMHEYKEGALESGSGRKVRSRKQAVAIALGEAGASDQQGPAENRTRAAKSRRGGAPTKAELYRRARTKGVPGRSTMSKAELEKAVKG